MKSLSIIIAISLACVLLTACGQSGPLYLESSTASPKQTVNSRPLPPSAAPSYVTDKQKQLPGTPVPDDKTPDTTSTQHFPAATSQVGNQDTGQDVKTLHSGTQQQLNTDNSN